MTNKEKAINKLSIIKLRWAEVYGLYDAWEIKILIDVHVHAIEALIMATEQDRLTVEEAGTLYEDISESFGKLIRKTSIRVSEEL